MKRLAILLSAAALLCTGCGSTADSSSLQESSKAENVSYVITYPVEVSCEDISVSADKTDDFSSLIEKVISDKEDNPSGSYSKKKAKEEGYAGGLPYSVTKKENGEDVLTIYLDSYYDFIKTDTDKDGLLLLDYPDEDMVNSYKCSDDEAYKSLCELINQTIEK